MDNTDQLTLKSVIEILWRGKKLLLSITLLFLLLGGTYSGIIQKPDYQVTTEISVQEIEGVEKMFSIEPFLNSPLFSTSGVSSISTTNKPINYENLITLYYDQIQQDSELLKEVQKINTYKNITKDSLKSIPRLSWTKDSEEIVLSVTNPDMDTAKKVAVIFATDFHQFITQQNEERIKTDIDSLKHQLEFNISVLENKIKRTKNEINTIDKTLTYSSSIIEPNPIYIKYLENLANIQIGLSNAKSQYEELQSVEQKLPEIAKEAGLTAMIKTPFKESGGFSSKGVVTKTIFSGIIGLMLSSFLVLFLHYWRKQK